MEDYVRLVVSDTHLGSAYCQEDKLEKLLKTVEYDELILAGDIIEFLRHPQFTETTARIFDYVSNLDKKVVYVVGNHDIALNSFVSKKISNISFTKSYTFEYADRVYRVQHGDLYDDGITRSDRWMEVLSLVQNLFERYFKIDVTTWMAHWQIRKRKLKRIWDILRWNDDADVFIMGHTHNPEVLIWVNKEEKIKTYVNCGDWVENCTYVIIKDDQVRLRKWK